jgi:hypothetical protein
MEIGLGAPRETLRLTVDGHLVSRSGAADHTVTPMEPQSAPMTDTSGVGAVVKPPWERSHR